MKESKELPNWLFVAISWVFSVYLLVLFHRAADFSQSSAIPPFLYLILFLGILLPFAPFLRRVSIGKFIEWEREIQETRQELKDFKSEVTNLISVVSTSINTIGISNLANTTNININLQELLEKAKEELRQANHPAQEEEIQEIEDELLLEGEDTIMALARTRIRLEHLLRRILSKGENDEAPKDIKFMSASGLFRLFTKKYPEYKYLDNSFEYVLRACNAAIHAQSVSEGQAREALGIGASLIATLRKIADGQESSVQPE